MLNIEWPIARQSSITIFLRHPVYVNNTLPLALAVHEISRNFWAAYTITHQSTSGADPGRGESGSSHGQIFSTLEYFALTFLKILD